MEDLGYPTIPTIHYSTYIFNCPLIIGTDSYKLPRPGTAGEVLMNVLMRGPLEASENPMLALQKRNFGSTSMEVSSNDLKWGIPSHHGFQY